MHLSGLPSMVILTSTGNKAILGLTSLRLLLDTLSVFKFFKSIMDSGNSSNLLLCKSKTDKLAALSKFRIFSIKLYARAIVSNLKDLGTLSNILS